MSEGDGVFLREEELDDVEGDQFDHIAYVDTLEEVVAKAGPPWHIGLFGTWGTGKSSIVNLLYKRIDVGDPTAEGSNAPKYDFTNTLGVTVNAWEHTGESIRTSLLLDLNRDLDEKIGDDTLSEDDEWGLLPSDEIMKKLYDVEEKETTDTNRTRQEAIWSLTRQYGLYLLLSIIGIVLIIQFSPITITQLGVAAVAGGVLTAIVKYGSSEYLNERITQERTMVNPRNEWTGAYSEIYDDILTEAKEKYEASPTEGDELNHIIITVDDLDRCDSASVYETLIALKSFMRHDLCTYIIPCDEAALYQHVQAADTGEYLDEKENQQHFLAKFFETRLRIPEIENRSLRSYAEAQNESLAEDHQLDEAVISVIMDSNPGTPRRITRALNRITTYRILAGSRSAFDAIDTENVEHIRLLAKITILQEDHPEFYKALERNEIALETIYAARSNSASDGRSEILSLLDEVGVPDDQQPDLIDFLIATEDVGNGLDTEPFLRLSGSKLSIRQRFENALEQERIPDLREMANAAEKETEEEFVEAIQNKLGDGDYRYSAFRATLQILESFENERRGAIANSLYTVLQEEDHAVLLQDIHLNRLRPCIERVDQPERIDLLGWYVDAAISEESVHNKNLRALLAIGANELELLYEVRERFSANVIAALDSGTITKVQYDEIVDKVCDSCPQLYSETLVRGGMN